MLPYALAAAAGYALGSISFALWIARAHGLDLRRIGSGNPGATNVTRALGRRWGVLTYFLDALKGFAPALGGWMLAGDPAVGCVAGAAAFLGHLYPAWHGFRGGKGVATLSGALLALAPLAVAAAGAAFLAGFLTTRIVSVGSLGFGLSLGPAAWLLRLPEAVVIFASLGGLALVLTHRSNLRRLLRGEEKPIRPRGGSGDA